MKKPSRSHDEATAEMFRKDPAFAAAYLARELLEATAYLAGFEPLPQNRDDDPCVITVSSGELRRFRKARARLATLFN